MKFSLIVFSLLFSFTTFASEVATERLAKAIIDGDIKSAQEAILDGADVNAKSKISSIFLEAVSFHRVEIVKLLLQNNADVNQVRPVDLFSGLMIAAKHDNLKMAKLLVENGIDVNLSTLIKRDALHIATLRNSLRVATFLVNETNINVNARGNNCALAIAARQNNREIVTLLKNQNGLKLPTKKCLDSAIHMAQLNGHQEILKILGE